MDNAAPELEIRHNPEAHRFEADVGGGLGIVEYIWVGDTLIFTHTEVPEAHEGQGIGSALARYALEYVRAEGLRVRSICPYMSAFLGRHPEYQELLVRVGGR